MKINNEKNYNFNIGDNLKEYIILDKIGKGGSSEVYLVFNPKYQTQFAAKVIKIDSNKSEISFSCYSKETETLKNLDHPNIIQLFDFFHIQNYFIIILEYCEKGSLENFIEKNGPFNTINQLIFS